MDRRRRDFLDRLLTTPSPSGFETRGQREWLEYVSEFADETRTDDYGNAVAVHEGDGGPALAFAGHADEIGYIVRRIEDEGFLRIGPIGGSDRTVSRGQHVTVHTDDGPVQGVIGQAAIHLRDDDAEEVPDLRAQYVDVGAADEDEARDLVDIGDPVTVSTTVRDLHGGRVAARGMDDRVGVWAAAEGLRRAAEADVDTTVYAVATVQEEIGRQGAQMVGFDLADEVDGIVVADVTHATDHPSLDTSQRGPVALGDGPAVCRGSTNHPELVSLARAAAGDADVDVQLQAAGSTTGTDTDAFYVARGGTPSLYVGIPNRYMHTPVEVVDVADLDAVGTLLGAMAERSADRDGFGIEV